MKRLLIAILLLAAPAYAQCTGGSGISVSVGNPYTGWGVTVGQPGGYYAPGYPVYRYPYAGYPYRAYPVGVPVMTYPAYVPTVPGTVVYPANPYYPYTTYPAVAVPYCR